MIPIVVAVLLIGGAIFLLNFLSSPSPPRLDAPRVAALMDLKGVETECAVSPDGARYAVIASGDLWMAEPAAHSNRRLTETTAVESAPAWTPGGEAITFTRGDDTFRIDVESGEEALYLAAATDMDWAADGRIAFVRERALWLEESGGGGARELVPADARLNMTIRSPRFSPSGTRIAFIKSVPGFRGEVWTAPASGGAAAPLVADRNAENPTSVDWILDDLHLVYMTDRSGGLAVWYIDQPASTMLPITHPLMGRSLEPLGIATYGARIVAPRHFLDSAIADAGGAVLIDTEHMEFDPAASPDGRSIAYTVEKEGVFEIWVAATDGSDPRYITLGRHPRWSPGGNELVYSRTDLDGNKDIWKVEVRTGVPERLTDAAAIDDLPDWSPDGRSIAFSSMLGDRLALWIVPSTGGRRLKLTDGGYAPRFSPDGGQIAYWHDGGLWTIASGGGQPSLAAEIDRPVFSVWGPDGLAYYANGRIRTGRGERPAGSIWPNFDRLPDGRWLISQVDIEKTELWTIDLQFTQPE